MSDLKQINCHIKTILAYLLTLDRNISAKLSAFVTYDSLTFFMKCVEYSGHGVLWLSVTIAGIFLTHILVVHEKLLNLLLGKLLFN